MITDTGSAYFFECALPTSVVSNPLIALQASLDAAMPDRAAPNDDADGDGQANIFEFFGGSDALQASERNQPVIRILPRETGSNQVLFQFHQRKNSGGLQPAFYYSQTLAADSWQRLAEPRYEVDQDMGSYRIRSLDLSDQQQTGESLFIKMQLEDPE
jgi:hypothetical protein